MYGNNIGGPFMIPNNMPFGTMMRGAPIMGNGLMNGTSIMNGARGGGISSLLGLGRGVKGAGLLSGARSFNLGGLLNGASKALGVVNQAIPIVKEVGPMMNNMKSMLKLASIFKDETDGMSSSDTGTIETTKKDTTVSDKTNTIKENSTNCDSTIVNTDINNNEPNFFL